MAKLRPTRSPNLPLAPTQYQSQYHEQLNNALRLYFAQIDNINQKSTQIFTAEDLSVDVDFVDFSRTATYSDQTARVGWNSTDQTLDVGMDFGVVQQVGQEIYARVRNSTGSTIPNGTVVGFAGADTDALEVAPYLADGSEPTLYILGVMTHDLPDSGEKGYCTTWGFVRGLDTSGFTAGDILYASPSVAGGLTNVKPTAPNNVVATAACVLSDATDGVIFVRPTITQMFYYGTFARTTDYTPAAADTAYAIPFDDTRISNGVVIGTPATRIVVPQSGFYDISATIQYVSSNAASKTVYSWIRANGVDVPESTRLVTVSGNGVYIPILISETVSLAAGEYIEIMVATSNNTITVKAAPATAFSPLAPAVNLVIAQVQQ